jgi:hypothetical protein
MYEPGKLNGLQGDLQFDRTDITWANMYAIYDFMPYVDYAQYKQDKFCFMSMIPKPDEKWKSIVFTLDYWTWLWTAITLMVAALFGVIYSKISANLDRLEVTLPELLIIQIASLLEKGQPSTDKVK